MASRSPNLTTCPTVSFDPDPAHRGRRALYLATTACLSVLMLAAVVDGVSRIPVFGVEARWSGASGGEYYLAVLHTVVTRPALASPFEIEVSRNGGFDRPVEVAVERAYLQQWDVNGIYPEPSAQRGLDGWVVWEFDPPTGDQLRVVFDGRIEPAVQSGRSGAVAVIERDRPVATVTFHTRVLP